MEPIRPRTSGPHKPIFATFYSFKGGVGRTMALLNAAAILAGRGRRVLMIDFDLEAPGLTLFQDRQLGEGASREQAGLVDALREFIDTPRKAALAEEDTTRFFETYVTSLSIPESVQKLEDGQLDLMPAGRLDDAYESRLYNLDFEELFERGVGKPLFDRFKAVIRDAGRYDYVLIDSRTGFSDEGSICTQYLGDYLVVLTGLNRQNVRGTARFLTRAKVAERKKRLMLVASPVPMYYEELRAERLEVAKQMLVDAGLGDIHFTSEIPYHPLLALDEDPGVYSLAGTDLFEAYEQITQTLRLWAGDQPEERIQEALDRLRHYEYEDVLRLLREVQQEAPDKILDFLDLASGFIIERASIRAVKLLENGVDLVHDLTESWQGARLHMQIGIGFAKCGEARHAINHFEEALFISRRTDYQFGIQNALDSLGFIYQTLGEVGRAIEYHEHALDISRENGFTYSEGNQLGNLGLAYVALGEVDRAIKYHEHALAISRGIRKKDQEAKDLGELSVAYAKGGRVDDSLKSLKESQRIAKDLESSSVQTYIYLCEAKALSYIQPKKAWDELSMSWEFILEHADVFERTQAHVLRARLLAEQEKYTEAAEAAQTALTFYQERGVDSVWSREAEELLSKAQAHQG